MGIRGREGGKLRVFSSYSWTKRPRSMVRGTTGYVNVRRRTPRCACEFQLFNGKHTLFCMLKTALDWLYIKKKNFKIDFFVLWSLFKGYMWKFGKHKWKIFFLKITSAGDRTHVHKCGGFCSFSEKFFFVFCAYLLL